MYRFYLVLLLLTQFSTHCAIYFNDIFVEIGENLGNRVPNQLQHLLSQVPAINVKKLGIENIAKIDDYDGIEGEGSTPQLFLYFGDAKRSKNILNSTLMKSLPHESTIISVQRCVRPDQSNYVILACNGSPLNTQKHTNLSFDATSIHYGAIVASYSCLEKLGFLFHHPLETYIPQRLSLDIPIESLDKSTHDRCSAPIIDIESPHWPERSFHLHTQHPLELTEVLQGHDIPQFGPLGSHCTSSRKVLANRSKLKTNASTGIKSRRTPQVAYCERWEDMLFDVDKLFQWSVANRLNKIEWLLLGNYKWGDELETRHRRLRVLTSLAHDYSLMVGADCPIGNVQQHAWHIVNVRLPFAQQVKQIRERVDWIFTAGFDFLTTESGLSEFTHPECGLMLDLMNAFAGYINGTWGREAAIKVHCSTKQTCDEYRDPLTGAATNFNFLPMFATTQMGIFPHTVQAYAFDDPTAGAYGNDNFTYIEEHLVSEAKKGTRSVMYYGETAYWVSVDVDVPLFLPIYGQRRQHDLRRIAGREIREHFRMDGQMNFDSGWEWGYWLNDLITARASWNPALSPEMLALQSRMSEAGQGNSIKRFASNSGGKESAIGSEYSEASDQWEAMSIALQPLANIFGEFGPELTRILVELTIKQADLLMFGKVDGKPSPNLKKLSGFPYISGCDTWIDLPRMFGLPLLQPDKVHFDENTDPDWPHVLPLLRAMDQEFTKIANDMHNLVLNVMVAVNEESADSSGPAQCDSRSCSQAGMFLGPIGLDILEELDDCVRVLALRATQVHLLYLSRDSAWLQGQVPSEAATISSQYQSPSALQEYSREIIAQAVTIVGRRESKYRVPWQRIAAWRENPTVYRYGYLWSVHSLYYWWRDQGLAEEGSKQAEMSPCYLNRMDASEVAVGWGKYSLELIRVLVNRYFTSTTGLALEVVNCFAPPTNEYVFPRNLYHIEKL